MTALAIPLSSVQVWPLSVMVTGALSTDWAATGIAMTLATQAEASSQLAPPERIDFMKQFFYRPNLNQ
jgi:hypothetical protein